MSLYEFIESFNFLFIGVGAAAAPAATSEVLEEEDDENQDSEQAAVSLPDVKLTRLSIEVPLQRLHGSDEERDSGK